MFFCWNVKPFALETTRTILFITAKTSTFQPTRLGPRVRELRVAAAAKVQWAQIRGRATLTLLSTSLAQIACFRMTKKAKPLRRLVSLSAT
jgi:hypothetical protein